MIREEKKVIHYVAETTLGEAKVQMLVNKDTGMVMKFQVSRKEGIAASDLATVVKEAVALARESDDLPPELQRKLEETTPELKKPKG